MRKKAARPDRRTEGVRGGGGSAGSEVTEDATLEGLEPWVGEGESAACSFIRPGLVARRHPVLRGPQSPLERPAGATPGLRPLLRAASPSPLRGQPGASWFRALSLGHRPLNGAKI